MMLPTHPRIAKVLMQVTWVVGGIGLFFGFSALSSGRISTAVQWVALWSVGGVGLLSFVRHAVFHRSDAVRMGWDLGRRNDFQIEVGFANLAWGVVSLVASSLDWGTMTLASLILVFGIYMLQAAVLHLFERERNPQRLRAGSRLLNLAFAVFLLRFAFAVLS
tara:strand:+ start:179 stop:667 length:489 start_codon:yes stop_codon:yes gene_type:complete